MEPLLSLLFACSLHLDDPLLLGVIEAFSAGNPWMVRNVALLEDDDPLGLDLPPQSVAEAQATIARILAAGGEPVVGLLPLRPAWLGELDKPAEVLFDPCQSIEVASSKISGFDYECRRLGHTPSATARRACTLERYGASLGLPALGRFVMVGLGHLASSPTTPSTPAVDSDGSFFRPGGIFFTGSAP